MTNAQRPPFVLSLYPRRYRARHGEELAQMYRDATGDAGPRARRREQLDIAAHAIRVRTHTGGGQPFGRFALAAAPYALAAAVSLTAIQLTAAAGPAAGAGTDPLRLGGTLVSLAILSAGALACAGRWPYARMLSALALVPLIGGVRVSLWLIPLLALVVLMPGAARPARTDDRLAAAFAVLTWLPWLAAALVGAAAPALGMVGQLTPALAVLAIRAAVSDSHPRHILAILVASVPWTVTPAGSPMGLGIVVVLLAFAWSAGRTARVRRRATHQVK
ncbi:hypothetical protein [Streptomyces sp. NPDC005009]